MHEPELKYKKKKKNGMKNENVIYSLSGRVCDTRELKLRRMKRELKELRSEWKKIIAEK